ncbi:MAG: DnaB-like helicase C-terminal domain-containing protein [Bryobacteraceae bacterium]
MSIYPDRLPEDVEAERALLATLCGPGADRELSECMGKLRDDDFMHPGYRIIAQAARKLSRGGSEVNALTLRDAIQETGELGKVGGFSGIVDALNFEEVGRPMALVDILGKHRKRRELIRLGASLIREAQGDESPEEVASRAAESLASITVSQHKGGLISAGECADSVMADLDADVAPGFRTGFTRLDDITQGFQPGQMIILAARPGIGKTALALNWAIAIAHAGPVFIFSLEMPDKALVRRMACNVGSVPQRAVKTRTLTEFQRGMFGRAIKTVQSLPILIDDNASITANEIRSHVLRQATQMSEVPALVIVDHVTLVASDGSAKGKNEATRIGDISRTLKVLAKEAGCPVVVLSQLNREVEKADRKPILSDLRDSGCLEQDADIVMFIHRKPKPKMEGDEPDRTAELIIAKHRDGECTSISMEFEGGYCRYVEVERETEPQHPAAGTLGKGSGW